MKNDYITINYVMTTSESPLLTEINSKSIRIYGMDK